MKNATVYEKKIRKLLGSLPKGKAPSVKDPILALVEAVLAPDMPRKASAQAAEELIAQYVDFNELRVAPAKEIVDELAGDAAAREKAQTLLRVLNSVFDRTGTMTMDYMKEMSRKDLKRHLAEIGLPAFGQAAVQLLIFDAPAVAVDQSLVDALKMNGLLDPSTTVEEARSLLERVVGPKQAHGAHDFLRAYVEKHLKALAKWRRTHPDQVTKPPQIMPPPKFVSMVKTQPLPPMKGEAEFEAGDVDDTPVDIEEATAPDVPEDGPKPKPPSAKEEKAPARRSPAKRQAKSDKKKS